MIGELGAQGEARTDWQLRSVGRYANSEGHAYNRALGTAGWWYMAHEVVWEPRGVYRRFWGPLDAMEYARVQDEVFGAPRFDSLNQSIVDFADVTQFRVTVAEAEVIAANNRGGFLSNPQLRIAFVTSDAAMTELLSRITPISAYPIRVFPTTELARSWLAVPAI